MGSKKIEITLSIFLFIILNAIIDNLDVSRFLHLFIVVILTLLSFFAAYRLDKNFEKIWFKKLEKNDIFYIALLIIVSVIFGVLVNIFDHKLVPTIYICVGNAMFYRLTLFIRLMMLGLLTFTLYKIAPEYKNILIVFSTFLFTFEVQSLSLVSIFVFWIITFITLLIGTIRDRAHHAVFIPSIMLIFLQFY